MNGSPARTPRTISTASRIGPSVRLPFSRAGHNARTPAWSNADVARVARVAEVWERVNLAAREVDEFNLERKPLVFNVFGWLAETARR